MSQKPNGIVIGGEQVSLRPLTEVDMPILYQWRNDPEYLFLWSVPRRLISYSEYVTNLNRSLQSTIDVWLMIVHTESNKPIGFVYSYDTNSWDGFTFLTMFLVSTSRGKQMGRDAGLMFVNYLMDYLPLRKIYADVFEFNSISKNFLAEYGFVQEGVFPSHRYYQGEYWSLYRMALYREKWNEVKRLHAL
jgi:RimJ/RimL family protein N-acetyltransferase